MNGAEMIAAERERQITEEGWSARHDDGHESGELAQAAACYALGRASIPRQLNSSRGIDPNCYQYDYAHDGDGEVAWPWDAVWWKPSDDPIKNLVRAGALIAAEIDRLQRNK